VAISEGDYNFKECKNGNAYEMAYVHSIGHNNRTMREGDQQRVLLVLRENKIEMALELNNLWNSRNECFRDEKIMRVHDWESRFSNI